MFLLWRLFRVSSNWFVGCRFSNRAVLPSIDVETPRLHVVVTRSRPWRMGETAFTASRPLRMSGSEISLEVLQLSSLPSMAG